MFIHFLLLNSIWCKALSIIGLHNIIIRLFNSWYVKCIRRSNIPYYVFCNKFLAPICFPQAVFFYKYRDTVSEACWPLTDSSLSSSKAKPHLKSLTLMFPLSQMSLRASASTAKSPGSGGSASRALRAGRGATEKPTDASNELQALVCICKKCFL